MGNDREEKTRMSSIVARAIDASTFTEMQAFTKDLEGRPIERLLRDVADLVSPTESKAQIVSYVIATKYRHADENERATIVDSLTATVASLPAGDVRSRVQYILDRVRDAR